MTKLLKDLYFPESSFTKLAENLYKIYPHFQVSEFIVDGVKDLKNLSLKDRVKRTADICHKYLPDDYEDTLSIFAKYAKGRKNNFYYIFIPEYIAKYGINDFDISMEALKKFTEYSSSEEAVRYFLLKDFGKAMSYIIKWADDTNGHVRRLSSECTRPRLPWAIQLKKIISDPVLTFPILNKLKNDKSKYVQKSVANHINDISKDNADWIIRQIKGWDLSNDITYWIVKHGTRTLIKQGHKEAMGLFGYKMDANIKLQEFTLSNQKVNLGKNIEFTVKLKSLSETDEKIVTDYKLYFMRKNGKQIAKIFKLSNAILKKGEEIKLNGKYSFVHKTTRMHYPGNHKIEILVNGNVVGSNEFELSTVNSA